MRRIPFLLLLLGACGGGGGGPAVEQQALSLRVRALAQATAGQSVPILVSVTRGSSTVADYDGEVTFGADSPDAWYPARYRFKPEDRGQHVFGSGFVFPPGLHAIDTRGDGIDGTVRIEIPVPAGPGQVFVPPPASGPPGPPYFFTRMDPPLLSLAGYDFALGDADGDGDLDLVVASMAGRADLWVNDGSGQFGLSVQVTSASTYRVAFGDIDGDGDLDLALSTTAQYQARIYRNDGNGGFADSGQGLGNAWGLAFGDVDGDGDEDLLVTAHGAVVVRANDGHGDFATVLLSSTEGGGLPRPWLADLDGDGDRDLVTGHVVWRNDGKGGFLDTGQRIGGNARAVVPADTDGDGDLDLLVGNYDEPNDLYVNEGNCVFTRSNGWQTGPYCTTDLAVLDLDEDGDLDIVEGTATTLAGVWVNEGGTFVGAQSLTGIVYAAQMRFQVGDIDGDGDDDFLGTYVDGAHIYRND